MPTRKRTKGERATKPGLVLEGVVEDAGTLEAIVRTDMGPVRVRGVVPGDVIRLELQYIGRNALWGSVLMVLKPSSQRVVPRCGRIGQCGGCPWQAWQLQAQREEKRRRLTALLRDLTGVAVGQVVADDLDYGFRNKLLLVVGGRAGDLRFGLYEPRSHRLVPAEDCPVQNPIGRLALAGLKQHLDAAALEPWHEARRTGLLRHVLVRVAAGTGQVGVVLAVAKWPPVMFDDLATRLLSVPGIVSVWANHQPNATSVALGAKSAPLAGHHRLQAMVGPARYLMSPTAFFQTHATALTLLLSVVAQSLPERIEHLLDLYSGVGFFTLAFAGKASRVSAVEANPTAAKDLAAAIRFNRLDHVRIYSHDASECVPARPPADVLIVDPPRGGLSAALLEKIGGLSSLRRIVYVSCSPRSLEQDLSGLLARGFQVRSITPIDLFPHTQHIETVVALQRAG